MIWDSQRTLSGRAHMNEAYTLAVVGALQVTGTELSASPAMAPPQRLVNFC